MKILIDIGHPAHVHYFKNFVWDMQSKGHKFLITARDKEVSHQLLDAYKITYTSRGKGSNSAIGKILYMFRADLKLLRLSLKFKPDVYLSFVSPYAAQVAWVLRKPHIAIDDTEHAKIARKFYLPFSKYVITPSCFQLDFGLKQIRVNSYTELLSLHSSRRKITEPKNFKTIINGDKYVILRFISWTANHDIGQSGIHIETKRKIIEIIEKKGYQPLISSESTLPSEFSKYKININPEEMHYFLDKATCIISEGATMASEAVMLNTPAIYVNSLNAGTLTEQAEKYGLISLRNDEDLLKIVEETLNDEALQKIKEKMKRIELNKVDFTQFLIDFIENLSLTFK